MRQITVAPPYTPAAVTVPAAVAAYPHKRAGHCGSGALRDLLQHHRLSYADEPLSEGFVFGIAGGIGFYFFELPQMAPPIYMVGRTGELERDSITTTPEFPSPESSPHRLPL